MIRTESEYRATLARIEQGKEVAVKQRAELAAHGLTPEEIERAMQPLLTFQMQYADEAAWYERVKAGDLAPIHNLSHIGQMLIGLRIARGLSQKELAERLGVTEPIVSRDERNEYHGITVERAQRVLDALNATVTTVVVPNTPSTVLRSDRELVPV